MKRSIQIIIILCSGIIAHSIYKNNTPPVDPLSMEAVYGRWRVVRGNHGEISSKHLGKIIEFSSKYIIVDGVQYNHPAYLYDVVPDFESINLCKYLSVDDDYFYTNTHDYYYGPKLSYGKHLKVMFENFLSSEDFFYHVLRAYHLVRDDLIIDAFGKWYEKIEDRPLWDRIKSYLTAIFSRSSYDPKAIVPKEMWGQWEIEYFMPNSLYQCSRGYREMNDPTGGGIKKQGEAMLGKRFFFHPNYVIMDDIQYNNNHYYFDYDKKICMDDYNGYKLGGRRLSNCNFPQSGCALSSNEFCFYMPFENELYFVVGLITFVCKRVDTPSFWQLVKYYFNYLIGRDASAKGFLNYYKLDTL